ncbi:peptidoglycan-binding protein [Amycolatopsis suaedae]|uniref:Peptidoglycan-binding protein n=1 Tax=Amycolatopsis suaedae TaxID=2510978 RepID=A0A4Q7J752_9PSEU|nr:peptidoglycan-binding protein [Amycolatopsis suaedae]RZQ61844.1 peptidoglycan-binding protein [Amycolatopsis suaedae]
MSEHDGPAQVRRGKRTRWLVVGLVVVAVLATGTVVVLSQVASGSDGNRPAAAPPAATAQIEKSDLAERETASGTIGYGTARQLPAGRKPGTLTWLPGVGEKIERGGKVYEIDAKPVPLFYGATPFFRDLADGMTNGPDVKVLEENLRDLGFGGFGKPDEKFTAATANAIKKWQKKNKLDETGTVKPGDVVVQPGAVRVSEVSAQLGGEATGNLLKVTGTERAVVVELDADKQAMAKVGSKVDVQISGGNKTTGTVTAVAPKAPGDNQGMPGQESESKLEVTVAVDDPGDVDTGSAEVAFTTGKREGVLTVPVGALLALVEGGYAVEVVEPAGRRLLPVDPGLFADGKVEIKGNGLAEGMKVVTTS